MGQIIDAGNDNSNSNSNNPVLGSPAYPAITPPGQPASASDIAAGAQHRASVFGPLIGPAPSFDARTGVVSPPAPDAPPATVNISGSPRQPSGGAASSAGDGSPYGGSYSGPGDAADRSTTAANESAYNAPGKSYTAPGVISDAVNKGLPGGSGEPMGPDGRPSMTTEQSNAYYGPINAAMTAKTEQDQQQNRVVSDAQSKASVAIERQRQADNDLMRAKNSAPTQGLRAVQLAQAQSNADLRNTNAAQSALTAARSGRDYTKEAGASQDMIQKAREAQLGEAAKSQGMVSGQQGIQKSAFELKHADLLQTMAQKLSQAKQGTPEYSQLMGLYRTMIGKDASNYKTQVVPGGTHYDPANPSIPVKDADAVITQDMNGVEPPHRVDIGNQGSGAQAPPADWLAAAKKQNPGLSDQQYAAAYASYKPR